MNFLFVALGGAVGAMARYAISLIPLKTEFPFLTLVNSNPRIPFVTQESLFVNENPVL